MKIRDIWRVPPQEGREIGIEIEMEGANLQPPLLSYWKMTHDGSLRGESVEYVLKFPAKRQFVSDRLEYLAKKLNKHGALLAPSDRCGVHVHLNVQEMEWKQLINLITLYYIVEDLLVHYCGEEREGNMFCLRARDAEYLLWGIVQGVTKGHFRDLQQNHVRYAALNLTALSKYGSVEFRTMRTPADIMEILPWVEMILQLKDASLGYVNPVEIITDFSMQGPKEFLAKLFPGHANKLKYKGYEVDLLEGVRRAQEVAYAPEPEPMKAKGTIVEGFYYDEVVQAPPNGDWGEEAFAGIVPRARRQGAGQVRVNPGWRMLNEPPPPPPIPEPFEDDPLEEAF